MFGFDRDVTAADGTVSKEHVYGSNEVQQLLQKNDQDFQTKLAQGWNYVDEAGESRYVMGTQEFTRKENETEQGFQERMQTSAQTFQEHMEKGYDQPVLMGDGKPLVDAKGNPVMKHIEGSQELSARLADRTATLQAQGMDLEDAHFKAQQEWTQRQYTGFYQLRSVTFSGLGFEAADMDELAAAGVPMSSFVRADGTPDFEAFFRWTDDPAASPLLVKAAEYLSLSQKSAITTRLRAAIGRTPTIEDVQNFLAGKKVPVGPEGKPTVDWINGTVGLEQAKNDLATTLQENGFTHDEAMQQADQDYNDKVRGGYWSVGKDGKQNWIRGTQSDQEYLLTLQNQFRTDEAGAQRIWDEQQRVGYDKTVETKHWDPIQQREIVDTHTIHIQGSQEFVDAQNDAAAELTRDGWDAEAARQEAALAHEDNLEGGYFRTVVTPSGSRQEWVPGRQEHQESLQQMQNDLVAKGWEADAARDQAQYIRSMATKDTTFLRQTYLENRAWYYENVGVDGKKLDRAAAYAKAGEDWKATEAAFDGGKTLTERLEQMNLDASDARFDAETARMEKGTIIEAIAGIVGVAGKELLLKLFPDGGGAAVTLTAAGLRAAGITDQPTIDRILAAVGGLGGGGGVEGWTQGADGVWKETKSGWSWSEAGGLKDPQGAARGQTGTGPGPWDVVAPVANQSLINRFGNWIIPGSSTYGVAGTLVGTGAVLLAAYGVYKFYQKITGGPSTAELKDNVSKNWAAFDDETSMLSSSAQQKVLAGVRAQNSTSVTGGEDAWRRMVKSQVEAIKEQEKGTFGSLAGDVRTLIDRAVFTKDPGTISLDDAQVVDRAWLNLPGGAKKVTRVMGEEQINDVPLAQKVADLAAFGGSADIMGTNELRQNLQGLVSGGIIDKPTSSMTVNDQTIINKLWEQMDGNIEADFATRKQGLKAAFQGGYLRIPRTGEGPGVEIDPLTGKVRR